MFAQARAAIVATLFFTLLLGVGYPLVVTAIAQVAFPSQAGGSLIRDAGGQVVGSSQLAQSFTRPEYLHPRPSAAGANGYDATGSSGSNLGPLNPALAERVKKDADGLRAEGSGAIPADAVTTSASGLDPHISPENAQRQAARIAAARGADPAAVERFIAARIGAPALGVLGQPTVNVLTTNLALDAAFPRRQRPAQ
ncbi:MAG: potassium-transporting ATPase subunit KdpC [Alphaproteobacteria bacterium]|nr:potassium-transporting ATPase subunit KdpC [Alphaproteobacteria bacterium]MBU1516917.1 potassium-transporting ATPase subunit KdpC [Alphaproteobacteria bacterium]MBU2095805.1 potassium-transporting ATPase subunit KdpC [Alphaproteobacteria bacterium]MBU2152058.1 potassium-transporting ATPase subunit KdpC [Alphaproteobacteria bacterium]MBU2309579.1 potassium-transporting ATPase subunit KdpC [Alphaproteobacteria bacterium]